MLEQSGIITKLEADENDNLVLPFPDEILEALDWQVGDVLNIDIFAGRLVFRKVEPEDLQGAELSAGTSGTLSQPL